MRLSSPLSRVTSGCGRPAGAPKPSQVSTTKSLKPDSIMVGSSGNWSIRFGAGHRQRLELARADQADDGGRVEHAHLHLAVDHRLDAGGRRAIGHVGHLHARAHLEQHARHVMAGADAARGEGELALLGARLLDHVGHGLGRVGRMHDQDVGDREVDRQDDQVLERIVARRLVEAEIVDQQALGDDAERVAVRASIARARPWRWCRRRRSCCRPRSSGRASCPAPRRRGAPPMSPVAPGA